MKRTSALILTAAMVFTLASCGVPKKQGTTEDHYRLTFSMHTPADTPIGNQFQAMFDDIEEKTNGMWRSTSMAQALWHLRQM